MAPKDLYYLPQVFIVTKDGSKEEFAGITQFGFDAESGVMYDNNMMYQAVVQRGGIFKGNMGHPVPAKISEEQIVFYCNQIKANSNFDKMSPEVKKKVGDCKPWSFEELEGYIATVESKPTSRPAQPSGNNNNTEGGGKEKEKELRRKLREKDDEIKSLKVSMEEERKQLLKLAQGKEEKASLDAWKGMGETPESLIKVVKESQEQLKENSHKLDKLTKHVEYMINRKGSFNAFLESFKNPLSGGLDSASITLTILGPEAVMSVMGKKEGPFGDDIKRLRSEGTVHTISLLDVTPSSLVYHFLTKDPPKSSPSAKSAAVIFIDTTELEKKSLTPGAVKFMAGALKTNLTCVVEESLKHYAIVILAIPPVPQAMIDSMNEIVKETVEVPNIVVVNMINMMDVEKARSSFDVEDPTATESPIKAPGWGTTATVTHAVGKAVQILNPDCPFTMCQLCWGCHLGECNNGDQASGGAKISSKKTTEETICLRCLYPHPKDCRFGTLICPECNERGHSYKLHEVTDIALQETIKTNFGIHFNFLTPDQIKKYSGGSRGNDRGGVGKWKPNNYQHQGVPRITAVVKK